MSTSKTQHTLGTILELAEMARLRKFTREEFYAMDRAGIFDKDYGIELISGWIITRQPPSSECSWTASKLNRTLIHCTNGIEYAVHIHSGLDLPGQTVLQPDFVVFKPVEGDVDDNPNASQTILIVEVSDLSLRYDRTDKMLMYAEAGIPEYWVVDVAHKCVFMYTEPQDGGYAHLEQRSGDEKLTVCGSDFKVSDIF